MQYRKLGKTGVDISAVSLGIEYIWHAPKETVREVVNEAIDHGVNYMDVFMGSPDIRGNLGEILGHRRKNVILTGHLGCIDIDGQYAKTRDTALSEKFIEDYYKRLRTDYIDVLFIHNIDENHEFEEAFRPGGIADMAIRMKKEGRARFIGFSTHKVPMAIRAVNTGIIDVLMFPVNPVFDIMPPEQGIEFMSGESEYSTIDGSKGSGRMDLYKLCAKLGIGVVAMKPFAAGRLFTKDNPTSILLSPVQCISYALSQPGVCAVVPGCKDVTEVKAALAYLDASDEEKDYSEIVNSPVWKLRGKCMYCNHCQPCPSGLDIGTITKLLDTAGYGLTDEIVAQYHELEVKASDCIQCGDCSKRCPFGVDATANMSAALEIFGI